MVLDLPTDFSNRLEEAAQKNGMPPADYLVAVVSRLWNRETEQASGFADENHTLVSDEETALLMPGILRGLEAEAQGRYRPAADVFRDIEAKYGLHPRK